MTRTLLGLLTLSLAMACTPDDLAVEADAGMFAQDSKEDEKKEEPLVTDGYAEEKAYVTTVDSDRDGEDDKVRYRDGTEKQIVAQSGDGSITCGSGQDDCVERPLFPLGPRAMTANLRMDADLTITSASAISRTLAMRMAPAPDAEFFGAPDDIAAVYTLENIVAGPRGNMQLADSLLIELVDGTMYETEPGVVSGTYGFVD